MKQSLLYFFAIVGIVGAYLFFRLWYWDTIEFGYDQPRTALIIQDFIKRGTYLTSQQFTQNNAWGNLSWGPVLVYLHVPFFWLTSNPIVISSLIALANLSSVALVIYFGWRFLSPVSGLIAGLVLALHPWWMIFSRMVYQPTFVPTLVALTMVLTVLQLTKPKWYWVAGLLPLYGILVHFYLSTIAIILPSAVVILMTLNKRTTWIGLSLGLLGLVMVMFPTAKHLYDHPNTWEAFFKTPTKFDGPSQTVWERVLKISEGYGRIVAGGHWQWQLGNAYAEFKGQYPWILWIEGLGIGVLMGMVIYHGVLLIHRDHWSLRALLLAWALSPWWFHILVRVPMILPRYFLMGLPAVAILLGWWWEDKSLYSISKVFGNRWVIGGVLTGWAIFMLVYHPFVRTYRYPNGFMSYFSDIPYVFLEQSYQWLLNDAQAKGYSEVVVSNNPEHPREYDLNPASRYIWEYVLHQDWQIEGSSVGYYQIILTSDPLHNPDIPWQRFGPYRVYETSWE